MIAVGDRAKARLDEGDHIVDQIPAELRGVLAGLRRQIRRNAVAERHDDDEWFRAATGTKVVEDEIDAAQTVPRGFVGVGAVQQIQHRVTRLRVAVVLGGQVHRQPPFSAERL